MSGERWERMTELFHAVIALPPAQRARFLDASCTADDGLRADVGRLVAAHEHAGRFIGTPVAYVSGEPTGDEDQPTIIGRLFGAYRVVREIGRGGMGAVYLGARADGEYEQRVAIKIVKRGMDTDLVLQRFRAERQILASLDHPNIGRLLDGGSTEDGRPYFVMEYIEGEPIDEYADARRLSIPARLELFMRVASAVAYAHRRLVVHRDIKPLNILVTPDGVPKLLDFGIAKPLHPGAEEPTASATGFRLLTPEYASPEQVDGRRATTASDVYSLGVVLYELLTGRSPYRLRSRAPLDVVAAVRTTDPERPSVVVTRDGESGEDAPRRGGLASDRAVATGVRDTGLLRRRLRGDLDIIVLMALRKEPWRRYQSVEEFSEDIRRHLDGLPVRARADTLVYRTVKFLRRNRGAVAAAALGSVMAMLVAAGVTAFRSHSNGVAASSLITSGGVLAPRDRIMVADFADRGADRALAMALAEAFRIDLAESPVVQVLSPTQVRASLVRMQHSPDSPIDDSLARELALREGVKALVIGAVAKVGGRYVLSAQLVSAQKGDLLVGLRETAADSTEIIRALNRLSARLRAEMGEPLKSIQSTPPLEQVTTASLDALRAYTEGVRSAQAGERERAIRLFQRAVALDTGFASAYRLLGISYGDMVEMGRATTAGEHALANQTRLPYYERYHTIATYALGVRQDYEAAIDAYSRILERYPDDVRALNNIGFAYSLERRFAAQETALARAIALDSTIPVLQTGLATAFINNGEFDQARRTLDRVHARFPALPHANLAEIYLAAARQDWDTAERFARQRLVKSTPLDSLDGLETLAGIVMTEGRLGEAERYSKKVMAMSGGLESPGRYMSSALRVASIDLRYRHDSAAAIRTVERALARYALDSIAEGDRPYDALARFFAAAGQPAKARKLIARSERTRLDRLRGMRPARHWSRGVIALAERRVGEAEPELRLAAARLECPICALPDLARSAEAAGHPDSAIAVYERYLATPWEWRFETDDTELGWSMKRLGELYETRGAARKAADTYARAVRLWGHADGVLQSVVADLRQRIEREGAVAERVPPFKTFTTGLGSG